MRIFELLKIHITKRIFAVLVTVFCVAAFGLYYIGLYEISFIDRPESWKNNLSEFMSVLNKSYKIKQPDSTDQPDDTEIPDDTEYIIPDTPDTQPPSPNGDTPAPLTFESVSAMKEKGYKLTDAEWNSSCAFALLDTSFGLPKKLSYSQKTVDKEVFTAYDDGRETEREVVRETTDRYALEMYMGYILYDDLGTLYLVGPDGNVMCRYDDDRFRPAYTRDSSGRPLFYADTEYDLKYPTETAEPDENGDREWLKTDQIRVKDRIYYYLSPNGQTFARSDYNDVTDNRGLYFDYPSYYGNSDTNLKRYCLNTTKLFTSLKGETTVKHCPRWLYSTKTLKLEEFKFDAEGKNLAEENGDDLETTFPYTMAYPYRENYATVMCDIKWGYDHDKKNDDGTKEDEYVEVTSNEMRIVDKSGKIMFDSRKNYYSDLSWTANERFVEPLSKGSASVGSYYFDHGYIRMRIQSYDRYYFTELDSVFIVSDEDVLVDPQGERYHIPSGYDLIAYSNGIMLLCKDGKYGYMNMSGVWVREPDMADAKPFSEGVAVCTDKNGKYGVISSSGTTLIPFEYEHISNISSGTLTAYSEESGWKIYQKLTNG